MNLKNNLFFVLSTLLVCSAVRGEDTDIYMTGGGSLGGKPLVMFALDYRPSLGNTVCTGSECQTLFNAGYISAPQHISFFELLRGVLRKVMDDLGPQLDNVKFGLMMNHNNNNNCAGPSVTGCSNGGYILLGFDTNRDRLHNKLADVPLPQGNLSHPFQGKELYFEFFRYLTGQGIYNGPNGWTDYGTNNTKNLDLENLDASGNPTLRWDTAIENGSNYVSPMVDNCSKVFVINFMFEVSQQEDDSDRAITAAKGAGGMNQLNLSGNNNNFSTVIRFMHDADLGDGSYGTAPNLEDKQNVTSYFFVDPTKINQTTNGYASAGGTNVALPLSANPDQLISQLKDVFKQILSVSATFVSAAVPVNVFNRTESLENVFFALFQPESQPRWNGNLKRLKLAVDDASGNLLVQDASSPAIEAISATDGKIKNEALTFWTDASGFDVVAFDATKGEVTGKDGRSVARGGAGQKISGFLTGSPGASNTDTGARTLFTEPDPASFVNGTATALLALNADSTTATALWGSVKLNGANKSTNCSPASDCWTAATSTSYANATPTEQQEAITLLKFARGLDVFNLAGSPGTLTDAHPWATPDTNYKPWLMADPLHSKPTPVDYGNSATCPNDANGNPVSPVQDIRILVAGNDGYLHMFRNSTPGSNCPAESPYGKEIWAFMPRTLIGNLKPLADNGGVSHIYGLDGTVTVYRKDNNGNGTIETSDTVYAYVGMRRGGKGYYALDISTPDTPKMLWSINKSGDFSELGLTFSEPVLGQLNWGSGLKPVVIFAGGYDINKDARSATNANNAQLGTDDNEGNAIYVVDAATGALIWKAVKGTTGFVSQNKYQHSGLLDSIPSNVTAVDSDGDEITDRIYVGDTGGVVWRADLPLKKDTSGNPVDGRDAWRLTQILSVGRHAGQPDRRFFHHPDYVRAKDSSGDFDAVVMGSGDREHPLDTNVQNQFYTFKDRNVTTGTPPTSTKLVGDLDDLTSTSTTSSIYGWRIDLGTSGSGEKSLASPLTFLGKIFFSTYIPAASGNSSGCGPAEGTSNSYVVNLFNAAAVFNFNTSNDSGGVTFERAVYSGSGIPSEPISISLKSKQYILPGNIPMVEEFRSPLQSRAIWKTFWYETN